MQIIFYIKFISCTLQYGEDRGTLKEDWLRRNLPDAAGFRRSRPAYFLRTVSGIPDGHFDSDGCNGRADAPCDGGKEKFL